MTIHTKAITITALVTMTVEVPVTNALDAIDNAKAAYEERISLFTDKPVEFTNIDFDETAFA